MFLALGRRVTLATPLLKQSWKMTLKSPGI